MSLLSAVNSSVEYFDTQYAKLILLKPGSIAVMKWNWWFWELIGKISIKGIFLDTRKWNSCPGLGRNSHAQYCGLQTRPRGPLLWDQLIILCSYRLRKSNGFWNRCDDIRVMICFCFCLIVFRNCLLSLRTISHAATLMDYLLRGVFIWYKETNIHKNQYETLVYYWRVLLKL